MAIGTGKGKPVSEKPLPIIAITTTAGTGSETNPCGVITKEDTNEKAFIMHPGLFSVLAVVDPELMLSVPPKFTAFQGFDALFHSVEGFIGGTANLASDMNAREANKQYRGIFATRSDGRQRPRSPHEGGVCQYFVWCRDVSDASDK